MDNTWLQGRLSSTFLTWNHTCTHCRVTLLPSEDISTPFCCGGARRGRQYQPLPPLPIEYNDFLNHPDISARSRSLNLLFSFSSLESTHEFPEAARNFSFIAVQGRVYHRVRAEHRSSAVRWILYDGFQLNRTPFTGHVLEDLPLSWINTLKNSLERHNPFVQSLLRMSLLVHNPQRHAHIELLDSGAPEIAAVIRFDSTTLNDIAPRRLIIRKRNNTDQYITTTSYLWEPLSYPLFFPHGTSGWGCTRGGDRSTTLIWHVRQRLLREPRFAIFGRLTNEYVVDMWSRALESRLAYIQTNLKRIQREDAELMGQEEVPDHENVFLPSSFIGSGRWTTEQVADSLAIAAQLGNPTFFITMTCNPKWEEITCQLRPGQNYTDIPAVVARVFHAKLRLLIKALHTMFPNAGGVAYIIYSIEFQKRGLPHAHILIKYRKPCVESDDIDKVISAELPPDANDRSLIKSTMMHSHPKDRDGNITIPQYCQSKLNPNVCRRRYPFKTSPNTIVLPNGSIVYRRRSDDDSFIVPHNLALIRAFKCHINVECANTSHLFQYIFKYIHKGPDYARYRLALAQNDDNDRQAYNEIDSYWCGRYLTAPEAVWRCFGYHLCHKQPSVTPLPVHAMNSVQHRQYSRNDGSASNHTLLTRYFCRPTGFYSLDGIQQDFDNLKYIDYYQHFRIASMSARLPVHAAWFLESSLAPDDVPMRVIQRSTKQHLARIAPARPSEGEKFYLRALLTHRPARSFEDLRTIDGHVFDLYQEAATELRLFENQREAFHALQEAVDNLYTPPQLRRLFVDILINECTETPLQLWEVFSEHLAFDHTLRAPGLPELSLSLTLQDISRQLEEYGKCLSDFGLPNVEALSSEVVHELERWAPDADVLRTTVTDSVQRFTNEQQQTYEHITSSFENNRQLLAFLDGRAGRGKTFLINTICSHLRSNGEIVIPTATSAFAAQLYPGGRTTHSAFKIPVQENNELIQSQLTANSPRADLLREAQLIIVDEAPMGNKTIYHCMDDCLRDVTQLDQPFGGKNVLLVGDFRQTCPVIRRGSRAQVVDASLRSSRLWPLFEVLRLRQPIRNAEDPEFSAFVDAIGDGAGPDVSLAFEGLQCTTTQQDIINFVWPDDVLSDPLQGLTRAILAPTNRQVDHYNDLILQRIASDYSYYNAADSIKQADDNNIEPEDGILDYYSTQTPPGFPKQLLKVKVGAIFRILRNLSIDKGIVKNTRVVISRCLGQLIAVRKLSAYGGTNFLDPEEILLPRITFHHTHSSGHTFVRRQFPLAPAYATTFNSCQGLTLDYVGIDLTRPVFSHGQLYTALTRIRNRRRAIILLTTNEQTTVNVTYPELLIDEPLLT